VYIWGVSPRLSADRRLRLLRDRESIRSGGRRGLASARLHRLLWVLAAGVRAAAAAVDRVQLCVGLRVTERIARQIRVEKNGAWSRDRREPSRPGLLQVRQFLARDGQLLVRD